MIIGSIAAIFVLVLFYNTAAGYDRNPVNWAISGFLVYLIVATLWTVAVNPGIKDAAMHSRGALLVFISRYAYIAVALSCAVAFNRIVGEKK